MALDRLTKVDGGGISTTSDYRVGIITASKFVGPIEGVVTGSLTGTATTAVNAQGLTGTPDIVVGILTASSANFSGNVTIGGTLTYEDVTNIDSVGVITARNGIKVSTGTATTALVVDGDARVTGILTVGTGSLTLNGPSNLVNVGTALTLGHTQGLQFHTQNLHSAGFEVNQINVSGIVTATGADINGDIDVDGHTELDNLNVAGVTTFNDNVHLKLNDRLYFGNSNELEIYQQGNNSFIKNNDDTFIIMQTGSATNYPMKIYGGNEFQLRHYHSNGGQNSVFTSVRGGAFTLYHAAPNTPSAEHVRLETTSTGLNFPRDIDVDGHTNLDNVSVSGVTTFAGITTTSSTLFADDFSTSGIGTFADIHVKNPTDTRITSIAPGFLILSRDNPGIYLKNNLSDSFDASIQLVSNEIRFQGGGNGATSTRMETTSSGVSFPQDIDVDGHTNLDNVSVVGITTITSSSKDLLYLNSTHSSGVQVPFQASGTTFAYIGSAQTLFNTGSSTDLGIRAESSKHILFGIGANEKLRISSDGNLGIGVSPEANSLLHVKRAAGAKITIESNDSNQSWINFSGASNEMAAGFDKPNNRFVIANHDTITSAQRVIITTGGDVGVGNDSPNCRLAVKDVAEHTAYNSVTPNVTDVMLQLYNNPPNETANDHATIQFGVNGGSHNRVNSISAVAESAGNRKLAFTFCTDEAGSRTEKMRISGDGNIGVNETSPQRYFHVTGNASYGAAHFGVFGTNGGNAYIGNTPVVTISTDGNANAGTNDEKALFQVGRGGGGAGAAAVTTEHLRVNLGGTVQIGGAVVSNSHIDIANTKLTIKQSANNREDGIYIERSGEGRGWLQYVGGAGGVNDGFCLSTNQLGTKTDVLAFDRNGRMYFLNPNSVGAWFGALTSPTSDTATVNIVSTSSKEASIGFSRSNSLGGTTGGWRITMQSDAEISFNEHNSGSQPLRVRNLITRTQYGIDTQSNNGSIYTPGRTGFHGTQWTNCGPMFPFFYSGERVSSSSSNYNFDFFDIYASGHWNGYPKAIIMAHERYYKSAFTQWTFGPYNQGSYTLEQVESWGGYSGGHGTDNAGTVSITDHGQTNTHSGQAIRRWTVNCANTGTYSYVRWYVGFIHTGRGVYMSNTSQTDVNNSTTAGACVHMRDITQAAAGDFNYLS